MTHNTELALSDMQENFLKKLLNEIFDSTSADLININKKFYRKFIKLYASS
jgi:hypothetical protein